MRWILAAFLEMTRPEAVRCYAAAISLGVLAAAGTLKAEPADGAAPPAETPSKSGGGTPESGAIEAAAESPRENPVEEIEEETDRGAQIYDRLIKSTAWIVAIKPESTSFQSGTGWVVDRDRKLIITNQHVVTNMDNGETYLDTDFRVYFPEYDGEELLANRQNRLSRGKYYPAKLLEVDVARDLAVLQLEELPDGMVAIPLAKNSARPGQAIHSLGNPGSSDALWIYSTGNVRQVYRAQERFPHALYDYLRVETQTPTNSGDSGGPAVNDRGELLAVNHGSHTEARLMTRFIDVSEVRAVMETVDEILGADTAEELNKRGDHYYAGSRYDLAIADYTAAIKLQPKYAKALGNRGWCWLRKGDHTTALADFNEAIELDKQDPEFYQGRARVHIAQEDYDKALADCVAAIRIEPSQASLFNQRGDVYFYQGKYEQAIPDYAEAIRLDGTVAEYFNNRGASYSRLAKNEEAIADYTKAIELDATEPQYLYNRASAYQKVENNVGMALDFVALEQNFPEFAKKQQSHYDRRMLRVTNATNERLQFWVKYYNKTENGDWRWFPTPPGAGNYSVYFLAPGESTYLEHAGVRINASKIRFWAGNAATTEDWDKSTRRWPGYEEQDYVIIPEEGEDGYFMRTYDLRLE